MKFSHLNVISGDFVRAFSFENYVLRSLCDHLFPCNRVHGPPQHLLHFSHCWDLRCDLDRATPQLGSQNRIFPHQQS